ncbi:hypothetical protein VTN96DRAFT_5468 [Rasamsonia emersonii]
MWLLFCLQCKDIRASIEPPLYPTVKCIRIDIIYYTAASFCIFTDLVILALPIRPLWSIQASVRRRIGLICIITLGGCSPIVSLIRLVTLVQFGSNPDFTYPLAKLLLVSAIEIQVGIMAANAPSLKAVWLKHVVKSLGSEYPSSHGRSHELSAMSSNKRKVGKLPGVESRAHMPAANADAPSDHWRNDSEEQLFQKENARASDNEAVYFKNN